MSDTWTTAYGPRRVRHDPPTLAEAIVAAQGFIDDCDLQIEFAASLMGVTSAAVRAEMRSVEPVRQLTRRVAVVPRGEHLRELVVERKTSRRRVDGIRADLPQGDLNRLAAVRQSVLAGRR